MAAAVLHASTFAQTNAGEASLTVVTVPKEASWALRLPKESKTAWRGVANFDDIGAGHGQVLYPGGLFGLIIGVATHGAIVESVKSDQKKQIQTAADNVLEPYRGVLDAYTQDEMYRRSLAKISSPGGKRLIATGDGAGSDWLIESAAVFSMTLDQRAIILDNALAIQAPYSDGGSAYRNIVRVVSAPIPEGGEVAFWTAEDGKQLKDTSAALFAESLDILLGHGSATGEAGAQRTVRFLEGGSERIERAEVLFDRCGRTVMKTLRGWLMSVPARKAPSAPASSEACSGEASK